MLCLSFGWFILLSFIACVLYVMSPSEIAPIINIVQFGILAWFVGSLFMECGSNYFDLDYISHRMSGTSSTSYVPAAPIAPQQ
jgi:hypothetical protein